MAHYEFCHIVKECGEGRGPTDASRHRTFRKKRTLRADQRRSCDIHSVFQGFIFVFRLLLRAIFSPGRPLVLLMEDLQPADPCLLDLLCRLISDDRNQCLLVIGTVDSSAVPGIFYLGMKLRQLQDNMHAKISTMKLESFSPNLVPMPLHPLPRSCLGRQTESRLLTNDATSNEGMKWIWDRHIVNGRMNSRYCLVNMMPLRLSEDTVEVL